VGGFQNRLAAARQFLRFLGTKRGLIAARLCAFPWASAATQLAKRTKQLAHPLPNAHLTPSPRTLPPPKGFNVCIFAYGQTGSGKTHTMSGTDPRRPEGRGINYRALDDLFSIRDARHGEVGALQVLNLRAHTRACTC
jgi:hypothetical protein